MLIERALEHWSAREWTLDSLKEKAGHNRVYIRTKTNCDEYKVPCTYMYMYCAYNTNCSTNILCVLLSFQRGTRYLIRESTFASYIDDLQADNQRSHSSYLAVQNLRKALPELQVGVW